MPTEEELIDKYIAKIRRLQIELAEVMAERDTLDYQLSEVMNIAIPMLEAKVKEAHGKPSYKKSS
jgi:hypothetical protein